MDLRQYSSGKRPTLGGVSGFPSIQFGVEMAFQSLLLIPFLLFPSEFTEGQNQSKSMDSYGWVRRLLMEQMKKKKQGFHCIKLKLEQIDFDKNCSWLYSETFRSRTEEIRVDANGAFDQMKL
jgi:hypothetical protein